MKGLTKPFKKVEEVKMVDSFPIDKKFSELFSNLHRIKSLSSAGTSIDLRGSLDGMAMLLYSTITFPFGAPNTAILLRSNPQLKTFESDIGLHTLFDGKKNFSYADELLQNLETLYLKRIDCKKAIDEKIQLKNLKDLSLRIYEPQANIMWTIPFICDQLESLDIDYVYDKNVTSNLNRITNFPNNVKIFIFSSHQKDLTKVIYKAMRSDLRKYNVQLAQSTIEANCNMKVLRSKLTSAKKEIFKLRDKTGTIQTDRNAILNIATEFYLDLFSYKRPSPMDTTEDRPTIRNVGSEDMPHINIEEVMAAVAEMRNKKSPGEDGVPVEAIKLGGDSLLGAITTLFNQCLQWEEVPEAWENAVITLLHKKGDITKLENNRPISLLSTLYKLFMKTITKRNTKKLDFYQSVEQAAFRSGFSTNDHLQVMRTLIEKCNEYKMLYVSIFIDFEKAFDSVGDTISPELFTAILESVGSH